MMNIDGVFRDLVGFGASWILWLLVALSVFSLAIIFERFAFFCRTSADTTTLRKELREALLKGELDVVSKCLDASPGVEARIVHAGVSASGPAEAEERMAAEAQLQRLRSERHLAFLGTLGNNAPFVGLLGTVIGIIGAFAQLEASGGQLTTGLMAEIGEALISTAVGLLVALPAVAAYNAFQRGIQIRLNRADALGREFVAHLHALAQRSSDIRAVTPAPAPGAE
jgi:biopolymer transport protein ExbB